MNGKLIALLIRSNALMIEALKMADSNAQARDGGPYHFETAEFNNLVADCELLAKEAEEYVSAVQVTQELDAGMGISVQQVADAAKTGAQQAFDQLNKGIHPMIPMSPAHRIEKEPLNMDDIEPDRKFMGRSEGNGQTYCAIITEVDTTDGVMGRAKNCITRMLIIDDKPVTPFERPLPYGQFTREFLRWVE